VNAVVGGERIVQFLARKDSSVREALERAGLQAREDQVFQLELPNHCFELHRLVEALAEHRISVISLYSSVSDGRLKVVLAVDQPANAVDLAAKMGFEPEYAVC
jgi:hypothetical protein